MRYRKVLSRRQQVAVQSLGWLHVALALGLVVFLVLPGQCRDCHPVRWSTRSKIVGLVVMVGLQRIVGLRTLAKAAVEFARVRGAGAVEGYAMVTQPGVEITWSELHVGSRSIFADAGMRQVAAPTERRVVMRIDF